MSTPAVSPGRPKDEAVAKRQRSRIASAIACLLALVFMYVGYQGRQHALLQARVGEITFISGQLQQKLEDDRGLAEPLAGGQGARADPAQPPLSKDEVEALIQTLQMRLGQFASDFSLGKGSPRTQVAIGTLQIGAPLPETHAQNTMTHQVP